MDAASAALLGMGLAAAGFAGAGVGIGYIFGKMIEAVARQPEAEARVGKYMWIGFALVEAIALYGIVSPLASCSSSSTSMPFRGFWRTSMPGSGKFARLSRRRSGSGRKPNGGW